MRHHVYFSPGMFGFGRLGSYNYFAHVERELASRFSAAGHELCAHVIEDLHHITAVTDARYPCAATEAAPGIQLLRTIGDGPVPGANDGVVPIRSQLWGTLVWAGLADHLDVLGHYRDDREGVPAERRHRDWLTSGSAFTHVEFSALIDAIAAGMLAA